MNKKFVITIVGGGAGGVSSFIQLVNKFISLNNKNVSITLIEKDKENMGAGIPYSTYYDESILNMRYQKMSILPDDPQNVLNWIKNNKEKWQNKYPDFDFENDPYPPRSLYGIYLKNVFNDSLEKAKSFGVECNIIYDTVLDIKKVGLKNEVILQNKDKIITDKIILCLGNYPATTYQELIGKENYFEWFWSDEKTLAVIPENSTVGVLGSGLTAIDISNTILSNRKDVKVFFVSQNGLLPKVQAVLINPISKSILNDKVNSLIKKKGKLLLNDLIGVLKKEIENAHKESIDWDKVLHLEKSPLEIITQDIEDAKTNKSSDWQSVLASTSDIIENFWDKLSDEDKQRFLKEYQGIWFVYRHAMPLKNAEKISNYLKSEKLAIYSGIKSVIYNENNKSFVLDLKDNKIEVPFLINATGAGEDIKKINSVLVKNLLQSGIFTPNKFGGINVDFETCGVLNSHSVISKNIYSIGYLTKGVHFYTNDVGRIAEHARRVVKYITKNKLWLQKIFSSN